MAEDEGGFTLIEMIVVLVVLALAGSIVLARGPLRSTGLDLRAGARGIATEMRTVRGRAIATDRDLAFTVDGARRDYGQRDGVRRALPAGIETVGRTTPILFHGDGSASGGKVTLSERDRTVSVTVDWLTGGVTVR